MTKTAKDTLLEFGNAYAAIKFGAGFGVDTDTTDAAEGEVIDQALKELEAIMRTLVIDYDNPLLVGHLSNDRKLEREFLRAEQRQSLNTALYGEEKS